jgi:hypothetical protein
MKKQPKPYTLPSEIQIMASRERAIVKAKMAQDAKRSRVELAR